jgi:hypothetical protein
MSCSARWALRKRCSSTPRSCINARAIGWGRRSATDRSAPPPSRGAIGPAPNARCSGRSGSRHRWVTPSARHARWCGSPISRWSADAPTTRCCSPRKPAPSPSARARRSRCGSPTRPEPSREARPSSATRAQPPRRTKRPRSSRSSPTPSAPRSRRGTRRAGSLELQRSPSPPPGSSPRIGSLRWVCPRAWPSCWRIIASASGTQARARRCSRRRRRPSRSASCPSR